MIIGEVVEREGRRVRTTAKILRQKKNKKIKKLDGGCQSTIDKTKNNNDDETLNYYYYYYYYMERVKTKTLTRFCVFPDFI